VRDMLGTVSRDRVLKILRALLDRDAAAVLAEVEALAEFTPDYENVLNELLSLLHHLALAKTVPEALDAFVSARDELLALSESVSAEDLQLFYQVGLIGRRDLPLAPSERSGFEMILLRMFAFRPAQTGVTAIAPAPAAAGKPAPARTSAPAAVRPASRPAPAGSVRDDPAMKAEAAVIARGGDSPAARDAAGQGWRQILEGLAINGMVKQLAANCLLLEQSEHNIRLQLDSGHRQLLNTKAEKRLQQALREYFDADIRLEIEHASSGQAAVETPAQAAARERAERQQQAEQSIERDGFVQALKNNFNAEIIPGSVKPVVEDN
jgi:DNA polymerase-3 subunit gamma/tau